MGCGGSKSGAPVAPVDLESDAAAITDKGDRSVKLADGSAGAQGKAEEVGWTKNSPPDRVLGERKATWANPKAMWSIDVKGDLQLSRDEFVLAEGLAERLDQGGIAELFEQLDLNHDGKVTVEDFTQAKIGGKDAGIHASDEPRGGAVTNATNGSKPSMAPTALHLQRPRLGARTLDNVNLALWEATKKVATSSQQDAEGWRSAERHLLYAAAGLELCRTCDPNMDGIHSTEHKLKILESVVAPTVANTVRQDMWARLGMDLPRTKRAGWKERLEEQLVVEESDRDLVLDGALLVGRLPTATLRNKVAEVSKRALRFLVSSTFTDTAEERNIFVSDVLPYVQEFARKQLLEVTMIEMRWGIREEASATHETSEICMRELSRALRESIGVAYVFLETQRYGFRPFPPKIPQEFFEALRGFVPEGDRGLLDEMFTLDSNEIEAENALQRDTPEWEAPPEFAGPQGPYYLLRSRTGGGEWWETFTRLQTVLRGAASKLWSDKATAVRLPECQHFAKRFFISVTEEELCRGLLWLPPERQKQAALVYSRKIEGDLTEWGGPKNAIAQQYLDLNQDGVLDSEAHTMVAEMGSMIPEHVPKRSYGPLQWGPGISPDTKDEHKQYLAQIADDFSQDLLESVKQAVRVAAVKRDFVVEEIQHHLRFALTRARGFCQTASTQICCDAVNTYLASEGGQGYVIHACSGAGKTSLMSHLMAEQVGGSDEASAKKVVVARFLGITPSSSTVRALLESLISQLGRAFGRDAEVETLPCDWPEIKKFFNKAVAEWPSAERPLVLFLDSLDQLDDSDGGRNLEWLPIASIPPHVRIVVSTLPDHTEFECLSLLRDKLGEAASNQVLQVQALSDPLKVLEHVLKGHSRRATTEQMGAVAAVIDSCQTAEITPLWIKIIAQMVSSWRSFDGVQHEIKDSVSAIISDFYARLERQHGTFLVRATLDYLTLSLGGVAEGELHHLLSLADDVLADVYEWWVPPLRTCPPLLLARLLTDLDPYLGRRGDGSGMELLTWYHRQFREASERNLADGAPSQVTRLTESASAAPGSGSAATNEQPYPAENAAPVDSALAQRHKELADYFCGRWAETKKKYNAWLSAVVQRPTFFPGEIAADRQVPLQPLVLSGSFKTGGAGLVLNIRRVNALVHHLIRAGDEAGAVAELCSADYIAAKMVLQADTNLLREMVEAMQTFPSSSSLLRSVRSFVTRHRPVLRTLRAPTLVHQMIEQEPDFTDVRKIFKQNETSKAPADQVEVMAWPSRPQDQDPCQLTIHEHESKVQVLAWSPCGTMICSGSLDTTVKICDAVTGTTKRTLAGHADGVISIAWGSKGTIYSGSRDHNIHLWDSVTGKLKKILEGHTSKVLTLCVSPDERYLISGDRGGNVARCWDLSEGGAEPVVYETADCIYYSSHFHPSKTAALMGTGNGTVFWEPLTGAKPRVIEDWPEKWCFGVALTPDGELAVSSSNTGNISVRNLSTLEQVWQTTMGTVMSLAINPSGTEIVVGTSLQSDAFTVVDLRSGKTVSKIPTLQGAMVACGAFSPDETQIATGLDTAKVLIWDAPGMKRAQEARDTLPSDANAGVAAMPTFITGIESSHGLLAVTDMQMGVRIFRQSTGAFVSKLDRIVDAETSDGIFGMSFGVSFSSDASRVMVGGAAAKIHDVASGEILVAKTLTAEAMVCKFSPDDSRVLACGFAKAVVWDAKTGDFLPTWDFEGALEGTWGGGWHPTDSNIVLLNFHDHSMKVVNISSKPRETLLHLVGHEGQVSISSYSSDATRICSCSESKDVILWDAKSGEKLWRKETGLLYNWVSFLGTDNSLCVAQMSEALGNAMVNRWDTDGTPTSSIQVPSKQIDGGNFPKFPAVSLMEDQRIAVPSKDGSIRTTSVLTGECGQVYMGLTKWVRCVCISPDGTCVAAGRADGVLAIFESATNAQRFSLGQAHLDMVEAVAFSPDGKSLVSGSFDKVKMHDATTGDEKFSLQGLEGWVTAVRYSVDGAQVFVTSTTGSMCWDAATGAAVADASRGEEDGIQVSQRSRDEARTPRHVVSVAMPARDLVLIHALLLESAPGTHGALIPSGEIDAPSGAGGPPVACFKPPFPVTALDVRGEQVCVGGESGEVVVLRASCLV